MYVSLITDMFPRGKHNVIPKLEMGHFDDE